MRAPWLDSGLFRAAARLLLADPVETAGRARTLGTGALALWHDDVDLEAAVEEKWLRRNPDWIPRHTQNENR
jgi:hypothetical protein